MIRLSELLHEIDKWKGLPASPLDEQIRTHVDAGNALRPTVGPDSRTLLGIGQIRAERVGSSGDSEKAKIPVPRTAYIIRSLKHPEEVATLRRIYGSVFVLIAAYSPRQTRLDYLTHAIAKSRNALPNAEHEKLAAALIARDEAELENPFGQNVAGTFPSADVFVEVGSEEQRA